MFCHFDPWLLLPWRRRQSEARIKVLSNSKRFVCANWVDLRCRLCFLCFLTTVIFIWHVLIGLLRSRHPNMSVDDGFSFRLLVLCLSHYRSSLQHLTRTGALLILLQVKMSAVKKAYCSHSSLIWIILLSDWLKLWLTKGEDGRPSRYNPQTEGRRQVKSGLAVRGWGDKQCLPPSRSSSTQSLAWDYCWRPFSCRV